MLRLVGLLGYFGVVEKDLVTNENEIKLRYCTSKDQTCFVLLELTDEVLFQLLHFMFDHAMFTSNELGSA